MSKKKKINGKFIETVVCKVDGESHELEVWQDSETGELFAVEMDFLEDPMIQSPYNKNVNIVFDYDSESSDDM